MQVNFSPDEYLRLCRIADHYNTTPAWMVRRYVEERAGLDEWLIARGNPGALLPAASGGVGSQGGVAHPHPQPPPQPGAVEEEQPAVQLCPEEPRASRAPDGQAAPAPLEQ